MVVNLIATDASETPANGHNAPMWIGSIHRPAPAFYEQYRNERALSAYKRPSWTNAKSIFTSAKHADLVKTRICVLQPFFKFYLRFRIYAGAVSEQKCLTRLAP